MRATVRPVIGSPHDPHRHPPHLPALRPRLAHPFATASGALPEMREPVLESSEENAMMREILEWRVMGERFGMGPFTPFCLVGENKTMHWHGSLAMRCW